MKFTITPHPFADWFFPQVSLRIVRLLRIALGVITLGMALIWLPHVREFFTSAGIAPASYVHSTTVYSHFSIFFLYDAPWFVYTVFGIFILSLLGVIFGRFGRLSAVLSYVIFISLTSRFPLVFYGAIDHMHSMLFFNMLHPVEGYLPLSHGGVKEQNRKVTAWSVRMIQICLVLVYFYASMQKIRYNTWWNGTEILNSLSTRFGAFNFAWLSNYPVLINIMTYGSWMSELGFALLVWNKSTHRFVLIMIIGMHIGVLGVMNASLFSEAMIASLIAFITPEDEVWFFALWDKYTKQLRSGWERSRNVRVKARS
jgi:hypothetical protein